MKSENSKKTHGILPPDDEIREEFVRSASGPGGQNVNKTSTAVRLTYDYLAGDFLSDSAKERLKRLLGGAEQISILAREYRSLPLNREAARERLANLLESARKEPKKRKKTKPTRASKERRLVSKARRSGIKQGRAKVTSRGD